MECDAASFLGVGTIDFGADPYHVSGCEQFVQHTRLVVANACGEDRGFPNGGVEVYAFKLFDHTHQPVDAFISGATHRSDTLSVQQERLIDGRFHRLDGFACLGKRKRADTPKHVFVEPLLGRLPR